MTTRRPPFQFPPEMVEALKRLGHSRKVFKLVDRQVVETDMADYIVWFATTDRHVGDVQVGPYRVSTVFIGARETELFETMVFGEPSLTRRYVAWDEAEAGHAEVVAFLRHRIDGGLRVVN